MACIRWVCRPEFLGGLATFYLGGSKVKASVALKSLRGYSG